MFLQGASTLITQHTFYIICILITYSFAIKTNPLESSLLKAEGNNVISPWSLTSTLIPLQLGSDGDTEHELNAIIGNYRNIKTKSLTLGKSTTALFTSISLLQSYKTVITKNEPEILIRENFNFTAANVLLINDLIENETKGLIKDVIRPGQLTPDTKMAIVNAFYFKGKWRTPFSETRRIPFFSVSGGKIDTSQNEVMFQRNVYYVAHIPELNAKIIEIPYAADPNNKDTSSTTVLQIVLPNDKLGLSKLMEQLNSFDLRTVGLKLAEVELYLPKFKISSDILIDSDVAKKIGLTKTFSDANLSKLSETNLRVDKIISKTVIDVDKDGTVAASGTAAFIMPLSGLVYDSFVVDHPFAFYIIEEGNILFSGSVSYLKDTTEPAYRLPTPVRFRPTQAPTNESALLEKVKVPATEDNWWIHTGKPEYLTPPTESKMRFQQPEPTHPTGIRFPYPLSDPATQIVVHLHLKNQSSLNNTV